jgi:light-regulated signal transduction histidine kinase (bacteriophytochrome)
MRKSQSATLTSGYSIEDGKFIASNKMLENFAFVASHDLKAPISSIQSYIDIIRLKKIKSIDEETNGYLEKISKICHDSLRMITEVLSLARIDAILDNLEDCSLEKVIKQGILNLENKINRTKAIIEIDDIVKDKYLYGRPDLLAHVFQNLISNSIKFNKNSPPKIRIGVLHSYHNPSKYTIFVQDNGIGIDTEKYEQIFNIFTRGKNEYEGSGIGLALVKRVIEAHGGNIWLKSKLGIGSTFFFTLRKGRQESGQESIKQREGPTRNIQGSE